MIRQAQLQISHEEYLQRIEHLLAEAEQQKLSGVVIFTADYILYYTGFVFSVTERPVVLVINRRGERTLLVPRLEQEHASSHPLFDHVVAYDEYPHTTHPMEYLARLLKEQGISGRIGADAEGYAHVFGYRGPKLAAVAAAEVISLYEHIEDQMMIKSEAELGLIRESVRWANMAHALLQEYTQVGAVETEVSLRASTEANAAMLMAIGPIYKALRFDTRGVVAQYNGRVGRRSTMPHAMSATLLKRIRFQPGDILSTYAGAPVWGYDSELERNFFMGPPDDTQRRYFDHSINLQQTAVEALKPGIPCAEIDRVVRACYERNDLMPYWQHHVGHAIGLRGHEGPFLDIGDQTIIQPGMVFTIEPGIYVPGIGGFRQSDTVVITDDGIEILTYYPRDIDSLTIPV